MSAANVPDGFELTVSGDRGEASRTMRKLPGSFRVRARRASMDWHTGDLLALTVHPDGSYVLAVRTTDGRLEERVRGSLAGPDMFASYARARNNAGSAEWIGQHDGRRYVNP